MIKYIIIILAILFSINLKSQLIQMDRIEGVTSVMSPPEAKLFERYYLDHPIQEFTGLPQIEIPLYTIDLDGLRIPLVLTYHSGGIKYMQYDGDVGVGWSIQASGGYRVNRDLQGFPDERFALFDINIYQNLLNKGSSLEDRARLDAYLAYSSLTANQVQQVVSSFPSNLLDPTNHIKDTEYDRFTYMLPSKSGHFVISDRSENEIYNMEGYSDIIKLITQKRGWVIDFVGANILDENGFEYSFGNKNISDIEIAKSVPGLVSEPYTLSWLIKSIKSPRGNTLQYEYELTNKYIGAPNAPALTITQPWQATKSITQTNGTVFGVNHIEKTFSESIAVPSKIYTDNLSIMFTRKEGGVISQIEIFDKKNNLIKKIKFSHSEKTDSSWHTLLTSISVYDSLDKIVKKFNFDYFADDSTHTQYTSSPDIWGYYNTHKSHKNLYLKWTDTYYENDEVVDESTKDFISNKKLKNSYAKSIFSSSSTDRKMKSATLSKRNIPNAFSLKRITYPTGAQVEYEYENNELNHVHQGNGLRIKRIITKSDNEEYTTNYTYGKGVMNQNYNASNHYEIFKKVSYNFMEINDVQHGQEVFTYTHNPLLSTYNNLVIYYDSVRICNNNGATGYSISTFLMPEHNAYSSSLYTNRAKLSYNIGTDSYSNYGSFVHTIYLGNNKPLLKSKSYYNASNILLSEIEYSYKPKKKDLKSFSNLLAEQVIFTNIHPTISIQPNNKDPRYDIITSCFNHGVYRINPSYERYLDKKNIKIGGVTSTESYEYDNLNRLISKSITNSQNGTKVETYTYPSAGTTLSNKNILSTVVQTVMTNNGKPVGIIKTEYPTNSIYPITVKTSATDANNLQAEINYEHDSKGNIIQHRGKDNIATAYLWGYNNQYPIAEIKNATYKEVSDILGEKVIESLSSADTPDFSKLAALRTNQTLNKAFITIYKYKPLVGIIESIDPREVTTTYEYDSFGRLKASYIQGKGDSVKKLLQSYDYNYKK